MSNIDRMGGGLGIYFASEGIVSFYTSRGRVRTFMRSSTKFVLLLVMIALGSIEPVAAQTLRLRQQGTNVAQWVPTVPPSDPQGGPDGSQRSLRASMLMSFGHPFRPFGILS